MYDVALKVTTLFTVRVGVSTPERVLIVPADIEFAEMLPLVAVMLPVQLMLPETDNF
jgi:hypothetical protein